MYTYTVDYTGVESPSVSAADKIKGGSVTGVAFYDGLEKLEHTEELIEKINDLAWCDGEIKALIDAHYQRDKHRPEAVEQAEEENLDLFAGEECKQ
jgi:hypothetical protein